MDAFIHNSQLGDTDLMLEIVHDVTGAHFDNFPARLNDIRAWNGKHSGHTFLYLDKCWLVKGVKIHDFMIFLQCPNPLPRTDICEGETKEQAIEQIKDMLGFTPSVPPKAVKALPADHVSSISFCPLLKANIHLLDE